MKQIIVLFVVYFCWNIQCQSEVLTHNNVKLFNTVGKHLLSKQCEEALNKEVPNLLEFELINLNWSALEQSRFCIPTSWSNQLNEVSCSWFIVAHKTTIREATTISGYFEDFSISAFNDGSNSTSMLITTSFQIYPLPNSNLKMLTSTFHQHCPKSFRYRILSSCDLQHHFFVKESVKKNNKQEHGCAQPLPVQSQTAVSRNIQQITKREVATGTTAAEIDLLIFYTNRLLAQQTGATNEIKLAKLKSKILALVAIANNVIKNSLSLEENKYLFEIKPIAILKSTIESKGHIPTAFKNFKNSNVVEQLLTRLGADLVALFELPEPGSFRGLGDLPGKYSVNNLSDYTLIHELGHNLGFQHNKELATFVTADKLFGFKYKDLGTVMARSVLHVVPSFSNPKMTVKSPFYTEKIRIGVANKADITSGLITKFPKVSQNAKRIPIQNGCLIDSDNDGAPNCVDECPQNTKLILKNVCGSCIEPPGNIPSCSKCATGVPNAYKPGSQLFISARDTEIYDMSTWEQVPTSIDSQTRMVLKNPFSGKYFYLIGSQELLLQHENTKLLVSSLHQVGRIDVDFSNFNILISVSRKGSLYQQVPYMDTAKFPRFTTKLQNSITFDVKAGNGFIIAFRRTKDTIFIIKVVNEKQVELHKFPAPWDQFCQQIFLDYLSNDVYYCEETVPDKEMRFSKVNAITGEKAVIIASLPPIQAFTVDIYSKVAYLATLSGNHILQCSFGVTNHHSCKIVVTEVTAYTLTMDNGKAYCDITPYVVAITGVEPNAKEGKSHTFKISRTGNIYAGTFISYQIITTNSANFQSLTGQVYLAPGASFIDLVIKSKLDGAVKQDASFRVKLQKVGPAGKISVNEAIGKIINDDYEIAFKKGLLSVVEGNSQTGKGSSTISLVLNKRGNAEKETTFAFKVKNSNKDFTSATADDFVGDKMPTGVGKFTAGQRETTITIAVVADLTAEATEEFAVELSNSFLGSQRSMRIVIQNDDVEFSIFCKENTLAEGDIPTGSTKFVLEITKVGNTKEDSTISWSTAHYTTNDNDFTQATTGTVTFGPGNKETKQVLISIVGDKIAEPNEEFGIVISNPSVGKVTTASQARCKIINDDSSIQISGPQTMKEGSSGVTTFVYTIVRQAEPKEITFTYNVLASSNQNHANKDDFENKLLPSGKVTLHSKATEAKVYIAVLGDNLVESNEMFTVRFVSAIVTKTVSSTIIDDDTVYSISAVDAEKFEGGSGTKTTVTFKITTEGYQASENKIIANVVPLVEGLTASDFELQAFPKEVITFNANEKFKLFKFDIRGDNEVEKDEAFAVLISMKAIPSSVSFDVVQAVGVIKNDDVKLGAYASSGFEVGDTAKFVVERTGLLNIETNFLYIIYLQSATASNFKNDVTQVQRAAFTNGQHSLELSFNLEIATTGGTYSLVVGCAEEANCALQNQIAGSSIKTFSAKELRIVRVGLLHKLEGTGVASKHKFRLSYELVSQATSVNVIITGIAQPGGTKAEASDIVGGFSARTVTLAAFTEETFFEIEVVGDTLFEENEYFQVTVETTALAIAEPKIAIGGIINDDFDKERWHIALKESISIFEQERVLRFFIVKHRSIGKASSVSWVVEGKGTNPVSSADFIPPTSLPSSSVTFSAGSSIPIVASFKVALDTTIELDESFIIKLLNPTSGTISTSSQVEGTIVSSNVVVEFADNVVITSVEGTGKGNTIAIPVLRKGNAIGIASVEYEVVTNSEANAQDFNFGVFPTGNIIFAAGQTKKLISFQIQGDNVLESDESFTITLNNAQLAVIGQISTKKIIIKNDDSLLKLAATVLSVNEKVKRTNEVLSPLEFQIKRSGFLGTEHKVRYKLIPTPGKKSTAVATARDFKESTKFNVAVEVTFAINESQKKITINVVGDNEVEEKEYFTVQLINAQPVAQVSETSLVFAIVDNDVSASFSLEQKLLEASANFQYTVTRAGSLKQCKTKIKVKLGEVVDNGDFNLAQINTPPILQFNAGQEKATFTFMAKNDNIVEADEVFKFILDDENLPDACGFTSKSPNFVQGTIINDDTEFSVEVVGATTLLEGSDKGQRKVAFKIARKGLTSNKAELTYTISGTINNNDLAEDLPTGNLITPFEADESDKQGELAIMADTDVEPDEEIIVTLLAASNGATISATSKIAKVIVKNDDISYVGSPSSISKAEGATGQQTEFKYGITRSNYNIDQAVTFKIELTFSSEKGANAADFESIPTQVTLAANQATGFFSFVVKGDAAVEVNEAFSIACSIESSDIKVSFSGTIENDDSAFKVATPKATIIEGNSGVTPFKFDVTRDGKSVGPATVKYTINSINGKESANAQDFAAGTFGQAKLLTFADGVAHLQVTVNIKGDISIENDEFFRVILSAASIPIDEAEISAVIKSDDGVQVNLREDSVVKDEGDSGETVFPFVVKRVGTSNSPIVVTWKLTSDECAANDFVGATQMPFTGTVTIPANAAEATINIKVKGDTVVEQSEIFQLQLIAAPGASVGSSVALAMISTDDWGITLEADKKRSISQSNNVKQIVEGSNGGINGVLKVKVRRTGDLRESVLYSYFVSVSSGNNYATREDFDGHTLPRAYDATFPSNKAEVEIEIAIAADNDVEDDEKFTLTVLVTRKDGTPTVASAEYIIKNDDISYQLLPVISSIPEGNNGQSNKLRFKIVKKGVLDSATTVSYIIGSASASADDITIAFGKHNANFAIGEAEAMIDITIQGDDQAEEDETIVVNVDAESIVDGLLLQPTYLTGVIKNDDTNVAIIASSQQLMEGSSSSANDVTLIKFSVIRTGLLTGTSSVSYKVIPRQTDQTDFDTNIGTIKKLDFEIGDHEKEITLRIKQDSVLEANEIFEIQLLNAVSCVITVASSSVTIMNDDAQITIVPILSTMKEGNPGQHSLGTHIEFIIKKQGYLQRKTSVKFTVSGQVNQADFMPNEKLAGTVVLRPDNEESFLSFRLKPDINLEPDEDFIVTISDFSTGTTGGVTTFAKSIITNDDASLAVKADVTIIEGDTGKTTLNFIVERSGSNDRVDYFSYTVVPTPSNLLSTNEDAVKPSDFSGNILPSGVANVPVGDQFATIEIEIRGDTKVEKQESFLLKISKSRKAIITADSKKGTITNDDTDYQIETKPNTLKNIAEGDTGSTPFAFVVKRTGELDAAEVSYTVVAIDKTVDGADFITTMNPIQLQFAIGVTQKDITVLVKGDTEVEETESFKVVLTSIPAGSASSNNAQAATILADDTSIKIVAGDSSALFEGDAGSSTVLQFVVTRAGATNKQSTVNYIIAGGDVNAADFKSGEFGVAHTISFNVGENSKKVSVTVNGDSLAEAHETFTVTLSNPVNCVIDTAVASGTIINDDSSSGSIISFFPTSISKLEGDSIDSEFLFVVERKGLLTSQLVVEYSVLCPDGATQLTSPMEGSLIWNQNSGGKKIIRVKAKADEVVESDTDFFVTITTTADTFNTEAKGVILNDDALYSIAAIGATNEEGTGENSNFYFTVTRSAEYSLQSTISYRIIGDVNAADFVGTGLQNPVDSDIIVNFANGEDIVEIVVMVAADNIPEKDEKFIVQVSSPSVGQVQTKSAIGIILNDDERIKLLIPEGSNSKVAEGNNNIKQSFDFMLIREGTITLSSSFVVVEVVDISTDPDDFDFETTGQIVEFTGSDTNKIISISVIGDNNQEADEDFKLVATLYKLDGGIQTVEVQRTIVNDDSKFLLKSASPLALPESSSTSNVISSFVFEIHRVGALITEATVNLKVAQSFMDTNFQFIESCTSADVATNFVTKELLFTKGESKKLITVPAVPDSIPEPDEAFAVSIVNSQPANTLISEEEFELIRIFTNDDTGISFKSFTSQSIVEGGHSEQTQVTVVVTKSGPSQASVGYNFILSGNTNSMDFVPSTVFQGNLVFASHETEKPISFTILGDNVFESDEEFEIELVNAVGAIISDSSKVKVTIVNDDIKYSFKTASKSIKEGTDGTSILPIVVQRTSATRSETVGISLDFSGFQNPAAVNDFSELPPTSLLFSENELEQELYIKIKPDSMLEADEQFSLKITGTNLKNVDVSSASSFSFTIENDDFEISISKKDAIKPEGNAGEVTDFLFEVHRTGFSDTSFSVDFFVSGVASINDFKTSDNLYPRGIVQFTAAQKKATIKLSIAGDTVTEGDETFIVTLTNPSLGELKSSKKSEVGIIQGDDGPNASYGITAVSSGVLEGNSETTIMKFKVSRFGNLQTLGSIEYSISGDINPTDIVGNLLPTNVQVSFTAGVSVMIIEVQVQGDTIVEPNEKVIATITKVNAPDIMPTNGITTVAFSTIISDDALFTLSGPSKLLEGTSSTSSPTIAVYTISRTETTAIESKVLVTFNAGSTSTTDFTVTPPSTQLIDFPVGFSSDKLVTVQIKQDNVVESDESYSLELSNPIGGLITPSKGIITTTIINDDFPKAEVSIVALQSSLPEGTSSNGQLTKFSFVISATKVSTDVTVTYQASFGTTITDANSSDFTGTTSAIVTLTKAQPTTTAVFTVIQDAQKEANENFSVVITGDTSKIEISASSAIATSVITNDDKCPSGQGNLPCRACTIVNEIADSTTDSCVLCLQTQQPNTDRTQCVEKPPCALPSTITARFTNNEVASLSASATDKNYYPIVASTTTFSLAATTSIGTQATPSFPISITATANAFNTKTTISGNTCNPVIVTFGVVVTKALELINQNELGTFDVNGNGVQLVTLSNIQSKKRSIMLNENQITQIVSLIVSTTTISPSSIRVVSSSSTSIVLAILNQPSAVSLLQQMISNNHPIFSGTLLANVIISVTSPIPPTNINNNNNNNNNNSPSSKPQPSPASSSNPSSSLKSNSKPTTSSSSSSNKQSSTTHKHKSTSQSSDATSLLINPKLLLIVFCCIFYISSIFIM